MLELECPWCGGTLWSEMDAGSLRCPDCAVTVALDSDAAPTELALRPAA